MHSRCSKFKESKFNGFPSIWVDAGVNVEEDDTIKIPTLEQIIETAKGKFDKHLGNYVNKIIAIQEKAKGQKKEDDSKAKKQPEMKGFFSKKEQKQEEEKAEERPEDYKLDGEFFVLSNVLFNEKNSEANPILST